LNDPDPGTAAARQPPPQATLLEMWSAYLTSSALFVVAELGVADRMADGPRSAPELATATGSHPEALGRVLRMLASRGVFSCDGSGRFGLTPLSECLRSAVAGSVRDVVRMNGEMHWRAVGSLLHAVTAGEPAFDHVAGSSIWKYFAAHPDDGERFDRGMANLASFENDAIARVYDFTPFHVVADIGGGRGGFIAAVLSAHPALCGVLLDEAHVVSQPTELERFGVMDRCRIVAASFLDTVPEGCDLYVFKRVLDGFEDEQAARFLRRFRDALPAHGRILGINGVAPSGSALSRRDAGVLGMDMVMLASGPGRVRTAEQFEQVFRAAGLRLDRVLATRTMLSIVEGVPT
jgi:hypothetical protein